MKRYLSILFLFVILFQSLSSLFILGSFYLNRTFIAETKCENRFEKIKLCRGHCYLTKELKKHEKKSEKFPDLKQKELKFTQQENELISCKDREADTITFSSEHQLYPTQLASTVFRPPRL